MVSHLSADIDITENHLTRSHHDHPVTCYVSELREDAHLSHSNYSPLAIACGVIMVKRSITFIASGQLELEMKN